MIKYMYKVVLGLTIVLLSSHIASAQDENLKNTTPEQRAQKQTEWMKTNLSLDSTAVAAVYDINLKYAKQTQDLRNSNGSRLQKLREMKASSEDKDNELKKVLTPEQFKIYQQKKQEMIEKMKQKRQEQKQSN